ncbi:ribosomal protein S5-alanine N-acetyltransferase [Vibrio caribbeanicus]|uniref:ribosomal protein S5-alanine N-acetyltransferase n=1 Tax=Vibrio caribbeanicus TaxID=701175 RepID=UPI0022843076|nr:ribosomal protein S5-alanine N-acetyltransferase [Vibrio caribbeanicus]MCY9843089.1 ribosomal protein S5-alanine N-acetyltransferase [Vibrio caribbeanicus]
MERLSTPTNVFETDEKVVVRTAEPTDGKLIADYFNKNREHLRPWEPTRENAFFSENGWTQRLVKLSELHRIGLGFYLLVFEVNTNKMLGTISFSNIARFPAHTCNLGYSLSCDAQGKGVMTRALKLAIGYMFEHQRIHRIMASYMPRNKRSESVLKRLEFVREGFAEDYLLINGKWEDHILTSLVNKDWK